MQLGGAALNKRLNKFEFSGDRWPTVTALTSIAALTPYLDYFSSRKGNLYSFPPGVHGQCDTSKSYHFWMAAYLAHSETANGTPPEAAAGAAYSAAKMYHVMGNLTNRGGAGPLLMQDTFSPASNIIRADLAYANAGALFGAGVEIPPNLDVDDSIDKSIQKSELLPKMGKDEAIQATKPYHLFGYNDFKNKFAPNEIFNERTENRKFRTLERSSSNDKADTLFPPIKCH